MLESHDKCLTDSGRDTRDEADLIGEGYTAERHVMVDHQRRHRVRLIPAHLPQGEALKHLFRYGLLPRPGPRGPVPVRVMGARQ